MSDESAGTSASNAAVPLLESKLHAPLRRRGAIDRPRLTQRRLDRDPPALTLVSAPAGFGKSTLLAEWFDGEPRVAWLALDARDNDPARFWAYLVAALQTVEPGVGTSALVALQSAPTEVDVALANLLHDLAAIGDVLVLVVDDYHVIETTELHQAMLFLLDHLPAAVRLVIASRADPPWPLGRLRARGELLEIRAADLRFTDDEAMAYFNESMGLSLTVDEVGALEQRTEGWVAALQLAALSMQGRDDVAPFIANFAGNDRFVLDYLVEEVLERQPDAVREFLAADGRPPSSDRVALRCRDRRAGRGGDARAARPGEPLPRPARRPPGLVPLPPPVRRRAPGAPPARAPAQVPELHRRASAWYEEHGDHAEAIEHALAGDDFEHAASLVELTAPAMRQTRQEATFRRWLEAFPATVYETRPVLAIALVGARMATGDPTDVESLLDDAERVLETDDRSGVVVVDHDEFANLPAQIAVYRAGLALLAGDVEATIAHTDRVLSLVDPSDHFRRGAAITLQGLAYWTTGDLEAARVRYTESVEHFTAAHHIPDLLGVSLGLADIQVAQGRLHDATHTFESALREAERADVVRGTADMHVGLSEISIDRHTLADAAHHLQRSAELGDVGGLPQHAYRWRVATARLRHAEGDLTAALALLDEAEPVYNTDFSPPIRPIPALKARVRLALGDIASARRWAADRGLSPADELSYLREFEHITLARILLADRDPDAFLDDALMFLDRLLAAAEAGQRESSAIELLVLQALAHHAEGDLATASDAVQQALVRSERENLLQVFVAEGEPMAALLRAATLYDRAVDRAQVVLAAIAGGARTTPTASSAASSSPGLVEDLTSRELDVLRLLRSDLGGPDIARELMVSLNTMRTHTKNIYMKLGVTNRREAVRAPRSSASRSPPQSPHVVMCAHHIRSYGRFVTTDDSRQHYEIRVEGHLGPHWTEWFDGLSLTSDADGTTVIRGRVVDQAALHGLLQKLHDAGIPLVSLVPVPDPSTTHEGH